ncbi:MAG: hypothetical protein WC028_01710 [Candidatus Obscuribacterales bacterium]
MNLALKLLSTFVTMAVFAIAAYTLSIVWRVSNVEQSIFGRSDLIPLTLEQKQFDQPPTQESYGKNTYTHMVRGQPTQVYEQLLNSFQHLYGSALVSYEIGELGADVLFKANEYFEAICWRNSGTLNFYLDTKKDLANNEVGRKIGSEVKARGLTGAQAEQFMVDKIFMALDGGLAYKNCSEYRITQLPSLNDYGCPLLVNIQEMRRSDKTVVLK